MYVCVHTYYGKKVPNAVVEGKIHIQRNVWASACVRACSWCISICFVASADFILNTYWWAFKDDDGSKKAFNKAECCVLCVCVFGFSSPKAGGDIWLNNARLYVTLCPLFYLNQRKVLAFIFFRLRSYRHKNNKYT